MDPRAGFTSRPVYTTTAEGGLAARGALRRWLRCGASTRLFQRQYPPSPTVGPRHWDRQVRHQAGRRTRSAPKTYENADSPTAEDEPRIFRQFDFTTDADGRFQLARVMPGQLRRHSRGAQRRGSNRHCQHRRARFGRRPLSRPNDRRHRSPDYRSTRAPSERHRG